MNPKYVITTIHRSLAWFTCTDLMLHLGTEVLIQPLHKHRVKLLCHKLTSVQLSLDRFLLRQRRGWLWWKILWWSQLAGRNGQTPDQPVYAASHLNSDLWKPLLAAISQQWLHTSHLGMKDSPACDNSQSSLILRIFIVARKLQRLLVCCLPPGGLTIPPFMRNQGSIREQQLELFKLYIFFFPSLHFPSFLLIQLIKSDQGCSDFSTQFFSLSNWESLCFQQSSPSFRDRAQPSLFTLVQNELLP